MQALITVALIVLLLFVKASKPVGYGLCIAMLLLELFDRSVAWYALRRVPPVLIDQAWAVRPLTPSDRRVLAFNAPSLMVFVIVLVVAIPAKTFAGDTAGTTMAVIAALAPNALLQWRVWSHNTWRAVARIPALPHSAASARLAADAPAGLADQDHPSQHGD